MVFAATLALARIGEEYYTIMPQDVGRATIYAFGRTFLVSQFFGVFSEIDVGKRIYCRRGVLQVELPATRRKRLGIQ